jgi:uncharacterized protein YfeS
MNDYSPIYDKAHPTAKQLLQEDFYWSTIDKTAPFGNDDGADTFAGFAGWRKRHKNDDPVNYLIEQLSHWGYSTFDYYETSLEKIRTYLENNPVGSRLITGIDASIIAIAFGQLYLEGTIHDDLIVVAKSAILRQLIPEMLVIWGTPYGIEELKPKVNDPAIVERESKLKKMLSVLYKIH